jgi:ABC-type thiamin/hydroxymethylpyrimidine transport system permease subunit
MSLQHSKLYRFIKYEDILAIGILSVLSFAIDSTVGLVLQPFLVARFGPLTGGLVSAIPNAIVIFFGIYLIPRIGAPTLYSLLFLSMTVFTASFGPPGIHKVFIGLALGITAEVILLVLRRREFAYFVAVSTVFGLSVDFTYLSWVIFSVNSAVNAKATLRPLLPMLTMAYAVLGLIGSTIAYYIFRKRLAGYKVIQKLRSGD